MEPKKRWHPDLKQDIVTFADPEAPVTKEMARSRTTWPIWIFASVLISNLLTIPAAYFAILALDHYFHW